MPARPVRKSSTPPPLFGSNASAFNTTAEPADVPEAMLTDESVFS